MSTVITESLKTLKMDATSISRHLFLIYKIYIYIFFVNTSVGLKLSLTDFLVFVQD